MESYITLRSFPATVIFRLLAMLNLKSVERHCQQRNTKQHGQHAALRSARALANDHTFVPALLVLYEGDALCTLFAD